MRRILLCDLSGIVKDEGLPEDVIGPLAGFQRIAPFAEAAMIEGRYKAILLSVLCIGNAFNIRSSIRLPRLCRILLRKRCKKILARMVELIVVEYDLVNIKAIYFHMMLLPVYLN